MADENKEHPREPVLDPIERVSEVVFGVLMAMSIVGTLSVTTAGEDQIRTLMLGAIGCNLAWGLTDAVMYLVGTKTDRQRKITLLQRLHAATDAAEADRLIADELPEQLAAGASPAALEALRKQLLAIRLPHAGLKARDYAGAFGVFTLVVLSTFPVVVPFLFIDEVARAMRTSNLLGLVTLFIGGYLLGQYAGGSRWRYGFGMAAVGAVLVVLIIALGG